MKFNDLSTTFHTDKMQECKEFYVKYFNVKVTFECDWYMTIQLDSDTNKGLFLSFITPQYSNQISANGGITLNLEVENVDAEYEKLKSTGIKITEDIDTFDWGCRAFSVNDPIGNILYIYSNTEIKGEYKDAMKE